MADLTPNKRPDGQSPEDGGLEKSLESLSLDELLASVKDDLARVDAMMNDKDEEEQAKTQAEAELEQETQPQKQTPNNGTDNVIFAKSRDFVWKSRLFLRSGGIS